MHAQSSIRSTVFISLFTALTAVGAYLAVPVGPVPIVLQNFFVLLAGVLLGKKRGFAVVTTYLFLGAAGLPVFHSGTGGFGVISGPTGGYLLGYLPAVYVTGYIAEQGRSLGFTFTALLAGALVVYIIGIPWLKIVMKLTWIKAFSAGFIPFIIGDALKIAVAIPIIKWLRPPVDAFLQSENHGTS